MTTHTPIKNSNRTALPRALLGRRRCYSNPDYEMALTIGQPVTLLCTDEPAGVVGRAQILGCLDEYLIQIVGVHCEPLWVQPHQIA